MYLSFDRRSHATVCPGHANVRCGEATNDRPVCESAQKSPQAARMRLLTRRRRRRGLTLANVDATVCACRISTLVGFMRVCVCVFIVVCKITATTTMIAAAAAAAVSSQSKQHTPEKTATRNNYTRILTMKNKTQSGTQQDAVAQQCSIQRVEHCICKCRANEFTIVRCALRARGSYASVISRKHPRGTQYHIYYARNNVLISNTCERARVFAMCPRGVAGNFTDRQTITKYIVCGRACR